jgi:hypothetical protein
MRLCGISHTLIPGDLPKEEQRLILGAQQHTRGELVSSREKT